MTPEAIASALRTELMTGALRPGTELPQALLAQRFGVSRIPIRDALRILVGEGLVLMEANRGAKAVNLTGKQVREIYDLRILLECDCLRRAAEAMTPTHLESINRARRKSDLDARGPDWAAGDWHFHRTIYQASGRDRQISMIETLRRTCVLFVSAYATIPKRTPRWLSEHHEIYRHIEGGRIDQAVSVLERHLEAAAQHLLERLP